MSAGCELKGRGRRPLRPAPCRVLLLRHAGKRGTTVSGPTTTPSTVTSSTITSSTIAEAENLLGVTYSDAERMLMLDNFAGQIELAVKRRRLTLPEGSATTTDALGLLRDARGGRNFFGAWQPRARAVDGVSLQVPRGSTLGIAGESGCGKSTLARMMVGLLPPTSGRIELEGRSLAAMAREDRRALHRRVQIASSSLVRARRSLPRRPTRTPGCCCPRSRTCDGGAARVLCDRMLTGGPRP